MLKVRINNHHRSTARPTLLALLFSSTLACTSPSLTSPPSRSASNSIASVPASVTHTALTTIPSPAWYDIGRSVQGRPIRSLTIGRGPRKVLVVGGIHGDEPEGAYSTAELPAAFTSAGLEPDVTLTVIEDLNPDGRAANTRGNANGVDINRNFPASNFDGTDPGFGGKPLSQNESQLLYEAVDRLVPSLILVFHSWQGRQFINFDGPDARPLAEKFSASSSIPIEESSAFAPTPGSLGSYFGRDRHISVLTVELLKGSDPVADWDLIRGGVIGVIRG